MSIQVELTYDMSKALGVRQLEIDSAPTLGELRDRVRQRFVEAGHDFEHLTRVAAIAVNGVLIRHRKGMKTKLSDGDRVSFLKAAAGG